MRRLAGLLEDLWFSGPNREVREEIIRITRDHGLPAPESLKRLPADSIRPAVDERLGDLIWRFKKSTVVRAQEAKGYRYISGKVFRRSARGWIDVEYDPAIDSRTLVFLSEEYFDFLKNNPELARYFALDSDIIFRHQNRGVIVESRQTDNFPPNISE
jgi:hypothetical protein